MTKEKYLDMMASRGISPIEDDIPPSVEDLPFIAQQTMQVFSYLPDRWAEMSGVYLGKDLAPFKDLAEIFGIKDLQLCLYFIHLLDQQRSKTIASKKKSSSPTKKPSRRR